MTVIRRLFHWLALSLGCVGVVACVVGVLGIRLLGSRLSEVADNVFRAIDSSLLIATIGIGLLIAWMGAGQVFMCLYGWKSLRRSCPPAGSDESSA